VKKTGALTVKTTETRRAVQRYRYAQRRKVRPDQGGTAGALR